MSCVSWIKIRTDMFSDEKIRLIEQLPNSDGILIIWVKLLALAGQKNAGGEIFVNDEMPYTDEMLAAIFHRPVNLIRLAVQTFQKFRMVEVATDQTIIISNWAKHQNVEGLDKIRQQNLERKQRQRQRQLEQSLLSRELSRDTHGTMRDASRSISVTKPPQIENKKQNRKELPPTVPQGGQASGLRFDEAKQFLHQLFGRKDRQWSCEENELLSKIVITREDARVIKLWFELPGDHEVFTQRRQGESTKRKQELTTFLRDYNGEMDKIHRFAPFFDGSVYGSDAEKEPPRWREFFRWTYSPGVHLPDRFGDLDVDLKKEYKRDFGAFEEATK